MSRKATPAGRPPRRAAGRLAGCCCLLFVAGWLAAENLSWGWFFCVFRRLLEQAVRF
jgi:hypothetical protein